MVLIPKSVIHLNYLAHPVAVGARSLQDNSLYVTLSALDLESTDLFQFSKFPYKLSY